MMILLSFCYPFDFAEVARLKNFFFSEALDFDDPLETLLIWDFFNDLFEFWDILEFIMDLLDSYDLFSEWCE